MVFFRLVSFFAFGFSLSLRLRMTSRDESAGFGFAVLTPFLTARSFSGSLVALSAFGVASTANAVGNEVICGPDGPRLESGLPVRGFPCVLSLPDCPRFGRAGS